MSFKIRMSYDRLGDPFLVEASYQEDPYQEVSDRRSEIRDKLLLDDLQLSDEPKGEGDILREFGYGYFI